MLLGQMVCEEREEWSVQTAKALCQRLLQDTRTALDKVCVCVYKYQTDSSDSTHDVIFVFNALCVCVCV